MLCNGNLVLESIASIDFVSCHFCCVVPVPSSVRLRSNVANPIPPFGSAVTLICTASLPTGSGIDVSLSLTFELLRTDPAGSPLAASDPVLAAEPTYITTATINMFGRSDSGVYTCRARASSASTSTYISNSMNKSDSVRVTTGKRCNYMFIFIAYPV